MNLQKNHGYRGVALKALSFLLNKIVNY